MANTLLPFLSKTVVPRRPSFALRRASLIEQLVRGLDKRLQVIWAPAGYGKTTLLVDLAQEAGASLCWYTFGPEDRSPQDVLSCLAVALRGNLGTLCNLPSVLGETEWRSVVGFFTTALQQASPAKILFLFDDIHHVERKPQVLEMLSLLIERAPANTHFVVAGRSCPPFSCLPRLDVQGEVVWVTEDALRFSPEEAERLLCHFWERPVTTEEIRMALGQTGGWPVGLVLLARTGPRALSHNTASSWQEHVLFRYMTEEVYSRLPRKLQRFLTRSSIFTEFTVDLCNKVLGTRTTLRELKEVQEKGLFLEERSAEEPIFRYHDLFRQFLTKRLQQESPDEYIALHRRAAQALQSAGNHYQAVAHYLAAGDVEQALALTKEVGVAYLKAGHVQMLQTWLGLFPPKVVSRDPELLLLRANVLLKVGDAAEALACLNRAEEIWRERKGLEPLGQTLAAKSFACRKLGQLRRAVAMARESLVMLKAGNARAANLAEGHRQLASALAVTGELEEAREHFEKALELTGEGDLELSSVIYDGMGALYGTWGDLDRAIHYLERARQGWTRLGNESALGYTLNNLGMAYFYRGEFDNALEMVKMAIQVSTKAGTIPTLTLATISEGILLQATGKYQEALSVLHRGLELAQGIMDAILVAEATSALGNTYRLLGDAAKAEDLLRKALLEAEQAGHKYAQARLHLSLAKVLCSQKIYEQSLEHAAKAQRILQRPKNLRIIIEAKLVESVVFYEKRRMQQCQKRLAEVASLATKLGYYGFLLADVHEWLGVFQLGALKRIGGDFYIGLVERVNHLLRSWPGLSQEAWQAITTFPKIRALALGKPRVFLGEREIMDTEWGSKKAKELLFFLLYHKGQATSDTIIDALWPEWGAEEARQVLKTTVYRLRRALYPDCLLNQGGVYRIHPQVEVEFDLDMFNKFLENARRFKENVEARNAELLKAISVYNGPFLDSMDSEWCRDVRTHLEIRFQEILLSLARDYLKRGQPSQAQDLLQRALACDPFDEEANYLLAQAYLLAGDTSAALHQIRHFRKNVSPELGITPGKRWSDLYDAVIRQSETPVVR